MYQFQKGFYQELNVKNEMKKRMLVWDLNRGWVKLVIPSPDHDTLISGRGY